MESNKITRILAACKEPCEFELLVSLASTSGGLVDDEVRKIACMFILTISHLDWLTTEIGPILLGYEKKHLETSDSDSSWQRLPQHKDESQVELDVNRSFVYYPKSTIAHERSC